ncbi:hypothetical protein IM793_22760 [Pedobacter sp. MR2016-19]|uniref:hypothetical protein n=1 Tax=Pedobacter sp. MR2016-19 TaxID=2780089 RepID=UPI001874D65B|nr:hypothetical protein [Pedobacter sp. MR2016-19]MBE5321994.1 hypothetical protein [Pedobacter sp. MR2016-19]
MKNFLFRTTVIGFFFLFVFTLIGYGMKYWEWLTSISNASEVYQSIFKSKRKSHANTLLIGDSVCGQLYPVTEYNGEIYSIPCSQATTLAGQFFLLNNFFKANKNDLPKQVILVYTPFSFQNNLDHFAFNYLLKPFYNDEYISLFDDNLKKQVSHIPFYKLTQFPFTRAVNFSPSYDGDLKKSKLLSPISESYLIKIDSLCARNDVKFVLKPTPVKKSFFSEIQNIKVDSNSKAYRIVSNYKVQIQYLPDTLFADNVHFKKEYIPKDYFKLVKKL